MITIISSTKTLDLENNFSVEKTYKPVFFKDVDYLVKTLQEYSMEELMTIMKISETLAKTNYDRYKYFYEKDRVKKPALYTFSGEVYRGMNPFVYDEIQNKFSQEHVRILSGLYGYLRPLDEIQEYRLEMATKLHKMKDKSLYDFWKAKITKRIEEELKEHHNKAIINLASLEYSKVIDRKALKDIPIYDVEFKEFRGEKYKVVGTYSKNARGRMVSYIVKNCIDNIEDVIEFEEDGYKFNERESKDNRLIFTRG